MKDFKKLLIKSLAKQKIASISKGAFLNASMSSFLKEKLNIDIQIEGKIKNNIYFIKSNNSNFSSILFLHKKEILKYLNKKLENLGFGNIDDIKII